MTVTLKAGTYLVELGEAPKLSFDGLQRDGKVDIPNARGASRQGLGSESTPLTIEGLLSGANRFEYLRQLNRWRLHGLSLKLESDFLSTVAFLQGVGLTKAVGSYLWYKATLIESLFKQISSCDELTGWSTGGDSGLFYGNPSPQEGEACIEFSITDMDLGATFEPPDPVNLNLKPYIGFFIRLNTVSGLSSATLTLTNDEGSTEASFASKLAAVDTWYRVILHKNEFDDSEFAYGAVEEFEVALSFSSSRLIKMYLDDLGAYE